MLITRHIYCIKTTLICDKTVYSFYNWGISRNISFTPCDSFIHTGQPWTFLRDLLHSFFVSFIKFILNHKRPATTASSERTTNVIMCKLSHTGWMESSSQPEKGHAHQTTRETEKQEWESATIRKTWCPPEATQPLYKQMKCWHQKKPESGGKNHKLYETLCRAETCS